MFFFHTSPFSIIQGIVHFVPPGVGGGISCIRRVTTCDTFMCGSYTGVVCAVDSRVAKGEVWSSSPQTRHGPLTSLVLGDEAGIRIPAFAPSIICDSFTSLSLSCSFWFVVCNGSRRFKWLEMPLSKMKEAQCTSSYTFLIRQRVRRVDGDGHPQGLRHFVGPPLPHPSLHAAVSSG